jgi:hypothetical protein
MTTTRNTNESNAWTGTGILFGVGATALGVFSASRPLIGVAVYAVTLTGALLLWRTTGGETSKTEEFRAASPGDKTLWGLGMASAVGFPALVAADGLGYFTWSGLTAGIAFTVAGLYAVFGAFSLWELYREKQR